MIDLKIRERIVINSKFILIISLINSHLGINIIKGGIPDNPQTMIMVLIWELGSFSLIEMIFFCLLKINNMIIMYEINIITKVLLFTWLAKNIHLMLKIDE